MQGALFSTAVLETYVTRVSILQSLPIRQFLLTNLVRDSPAHHLRLRIPLEVIASNLENLGDFLFKDPGEVTFEGPALFIRGTKSHYVSDDVLPLIKGFFPNFQLLDINSGHWVISERPEAFREGKAIDHLCKSALTR